MSSLLEQAEEKLAILAAELRTERNERAKAEALCRVQAARIDLLQATLRALQTTPHVPTSAQINEFLAVVGAYCDGYDLRHIREAFAAYEAARVELVRPLPGVVPYASTLPHLPDAGAGERP